MLKKTRPSKGISAASKSSSSPPLLPHESVLDADLTDAKNKIKWKTLISIALYSILYNNVN